MSLYFPLGSYAFGSHDTPSDAGLTLVIITFRGGELGTVEL